MTSEQQLVEHTPGPWAWETPMGENCPWIVQAGKEAFEWEPIATLGDCLEDGPSRRSKAFRRIQADARLIAAAPDLLEALEAIATLRPAGDCKNRLIVQMERIALTAIAKARGQALQPLDKDQAT